MFGLTATWLRSCLLNRDPRIAISSPSHIALSARFRISPDGFPPQGKITIGKQARICDGALLAPYGGTISIGERVFLGPYCVLYGHGGLEIGNDVLIAAHVTIIPANHGIARIDIPIGNQSSSKKGVRIGDEVWIGTGARILDGVTIGKGAVVGAGAVVTRSLEDYAIALGVPARVTGSRRDRTGPES